MKHLLSSHQFMELFKKVGLLQNTFTFLQHIHHRAALFKTSLPKSMFKDACVGYVYPADGRKSQTGKHTYYLCVCRLHRIQH